jgi:hypothetical protein
LHYRSCISLSLSLSVSCGGGESTCGHRVFGKWCGEEISDFLLLLNYKSTPWSLEDSSILSPRSPKLICSQLVCKDFLSSKLLLVSILHGFNLI